METDAIEVYNTPEETKVVRSTRKSITRTRISRVFLLIFASVALMINNLLYISYIPLVYKQYFKNSVKEIMYFYGVLYASKDIALLIASPLTGYLIDHVGFDEPMIGGLGFVMLSGIISAFADSYWLFFTNRIFQGLASALTDISIMAMVPELFLKQRPRTNAFGTIFIFASLILLIASPFVAVLSRYLYNYRITFLTFDVIVLVNGLILFSLTKRLRCVQTEEAQANTTKADIVPMWRLIIDPYIILCLGCLMVSQAVLSFFIYVSSLWDGASVAISSSLEITCFFTVLSHILATGFTLLLMKKYPRKQWLIIAAGITVEGFCGLIVTSYNSYVLFIICACGAVFAVTMVRIIILPTLARLADAHQVSKYGSVYAIAYMSYAIVDIISPILLYNLITHTTLMILFACVAVLNILYAPLLYFLRNIY